MRTKIITLFSTGGKRVKIKKIIGIAYDNRMDFEDCVSSNNPELESEISNNKKFYESLKNIYELNEISNIWISVYSDSIGFNFKRPLRGQSDRIVYGEDIKKFSYTHIIEENWALEMKPEYDHSH